MVNAHMGALASGLALYKASWYANLQNTTTAFTAFDGGTALFASADGFPSGVGAAGDDPTDAADCAAIFNGIIDDTLSTGQNAGVTASATTQTAAWHGSSHRQRRY